MPKKEIIMLMQLMRRQPSKVERLIRAGLGYGLSMRSQREWEKIEAEERALNDVVDQTHALIEWAHVEYEKAKSKYRQSDIKVYLDLHLNWSPERVMSRNKLFIALCRQLQDEKIWKKLNRKERAFIADAVSFLKKEKRK